MMWILETADLTSERVTFRIPAGSVKTIGRATGAEFILDRALVSRLHCQLTATDDCVQVKDLGSTNGTFVNGQRVETSDLRDGDTLALGRVALLLSRSD
jgi:pSer/pThr/pTyr-binding forkhead associated (FHA) protein